MYAVKALYTGCPKKTITLLISIYFYITTSSGMELTYTIRETNILQESAIETDPTPMLLPWLSWKQICCFFRFLKKILEIEQVTSYMVF